jgi:hypothetical protein
MQTRFDGCSAALLHWSLALSRGSLIVKGSSMHLRPLSITIIGWFLVISALSSVPSFIRHATGKSPTKEVATRSVIPVAIQQPVFYAVTLVHLICGYFLLRGKNWARLLAVAWSFLHLIFSVVVSPTLMTLFFAVPMVLTEAYFLFRRPANEFFAAVEAGATIGNELSWRRIVSNCFYIAAALFFSSSCLIAFMNSPASAGDPRFSGMDWKWFMIMMASVVPLILLGVGQAVSGGPNRRRELGIVLLAAAAGGIAVFVMITLLSLGTDWQQTLPAEKRWSLTDYGNGAIWIGLLAGAGGLALWAGRERESGQLKMKRG